MDGGSGVPEKTMRSTTITLLNVIIIIPAIITWYICIYHLSRRTTIPSSMSLSMTSIISSEVLPDQKDDKRRDDKNNKEDDDAKRLLLVCSHELAFHDRTGGQQ